jgi:transcriptional regulator with XRE-family HTH domain
VVQFAPMPTTRMLARARRQAGELRRGLGGDVRRQREDAGLSGRDLAAAAGIDPAHLRRIEAGTAHPSLEVYEQLSAVLGSDLVAHLYPNTGPAIRDRHQARILEALLQVLHPRWRPYPEVAVRHPSRGWVDVVLHEAREQRLVATEIQSSLQRLEQLIRWSAEKAAALPSWEGFGHLGPIEATSQLLVVRSTRATRTVGREFARQLEAAYPAHPADALDALAGTRPWPGNALVWAELGQGEAHFLRRR